MPCCSWQGVHWSNIAFDNSEVFFQSTDSVESSMHVRERYSERTATKTPTSKASK